MPILGSPATEYLPLPIARIGDFADRGLYSLDITGANADGTPRGPFNRRKLTSGAPTYPMLWAHDAKKERGLIVTPDSEGQIKSIDARSDRQILNKKVERIWASATRTHYSGDLRFNSQSLIVAMTEQPCIGGMAWPSIIFRNGNPVHEYAFSLWSNSTLGLLLHWWTANKTQSGRGRISVTGHTRIPTLDVRALSPEQHERAWAAFEALRNARFLPFDQIYDDENGSDPARAELDRALLVDVLGLPESLCADGGQLETLRRQLAAEPQIHGGKRTRVVFTATGERTERRADR